MTLNQNDGFSDSLLTIDEVARLWNVSKGTVRNEAKRGRIREIRFGLKGGAVRYLQSDILKMILPGNDDNTSGPLVLAN